MAQLVFDAVRLTRVDPGSGSGSGSDFAGKPRTTAAAARSAAARAGCSRYLCWYGGAAWTSVDPGSNQEAPMRLIVVWFVMLAAACGPSRDRPHGGGGDGSGTDSCGGGMCSSDLPQRARLQRQRRHDLPRRSRLRRRARACRRASRPTDNKSSIGCDYYAVDPDIDHRRRTARASRRSSRTRGARRSSITVEHGGQSLPVDTSRASRRARARRSPTRRSPNGMLQPGQVAILFLAQLRRRARRLPERASPPAVTSADAAVHGTGDGTAFHITTSAPVVAYDIFPYGGGDVGGDERDAAACRPRRGTPTTSASTRSGRASRHVRGRAAVHRDRRRGRTARTSRSARRVAIVGGTGVAPARRGHDRDVHARRGPGPAVHAGPRS